jgi:hypothetical protein
MRCLLGLIVAGGILLGQAAEADAQVTFSFGGGGSPGVSVGQPYAGYAPGYGQGYYGAPSYPYGYGGTSYYQQGYAYPGSATYSSAYRGYYSAGPGSYGSTTYGAYPGTGYAPYGGYPGYAPYGSSSGINISPAYGGGAYIQTPVRSFRVR